MFRQELFSLSGGYRDINVTNAVLSHLWTSFQAWLLPSGLAVCGPNAFTADTSFQICDDFFSSMYICIYVNLTDQLVETITAKTRKQSSLSNFFSRVFYSLQWRLTSKGTSEGWEHSWDELGNVRWGCLAWTCVRRMIPVGRCTEMYWDLVYHVVKAHRHTYSFSLIHTNKIPTVVPFLH